MKQHCYLEWPKCDQSNYFIFDCKMWINCFDQLIHGSDIMLVGGEVGGKIFEVPLLVESISIQFFMITLPKE